MSGGEGDYMSMIMFIFHFIKSCDDDECFVCPTCHAVTLNLCNFLEKCWVKKSLTARNWYFQLILSILLVYFVEFLFGFGINLILLFNQMHCTTQKREREREGGTFVAAGQQVTMIIRILTLCVHSVFFFFFFENVAQSCYTLERPSHCNRKLRTWLEI